MARVAEAEVERLKEQVSLVSLVTTHGGGAAQGGADLVGRCPFHEDRTPSLVVTPGREASARRVYAAVSPPLRYSQAADVRTVRPVCT